MYAAFILEDPSWIGVIFAVMSVFSCIPSVMVEPLIKKLGEENLVRITFVLFAIAFIIGANVTSVLTAMMFSAVFGLGIGIIMPVQMIMLLPLSPDHVRGAFISIQKSDAPSWAGHWTSALWIHVCKGWTSRRILRGSSSFSHRIHYIFEISQERKIIWKLQKD